MCDNIVNTFGQNKDALKLKKKSETMEQHVFRFFIDYRGHHRKGVAIYNAT